MAFGFDDFARLFDPVSDVLGTSGKQGIGLLQQKPEDLAMLAALAAGGGGGTISGADKTSVAIVCIKVADSASAAAGASCGSCSWGWGGRTGLGGANALMPVAW